MSRSAIAAGVVVLLAVILAIVFARPVINYFRQQTADAEAREEQAVDNSVGRELEVEGTQIVAAAAEAQRVEITVTQRKADALEIETRADETTAGSLSDDALRRIRDHDDLLCGSGVACSDDRPAAEAGPSGDSPGAVLP